MNTRNEPLAKAINNLELIAKAHVGSFTRKDGTFVKEHDDGRKAAIARAVSQGMKDHLKSGSHGPFRAVAAHLGRPDWQTHPAPGELEKMPHDKLQEAHDHLYSGKPLPGGADYELARGRRESGKHVERNPLSHEDHNSISVYPYKDGKDDAQSHFDEIDAHLKESGGEEKGSWGTKGKSSEYGRTYLMKDGKSVTISKTGGVYGNHQVGVTRSKS